MGSLITETPFSEITATLEILDRFGVGRDDLKKFRAASSEVQSHMAHIFKTADTCVAISTTNKGTKHPIFPVYLEIETGGKSKDKRVAELKASGCVVSDRAKDIMSKSAWTPGEKQIVKFGRAKVRELGFTKSPTTKQIWARIRELGHTLCEPCDGPAIRLALKDQPRGDYFWTAMDQIADSDGNPGVFYVSRRDDGRSWLDTSWARPDNEWVLDFEIVFRLSK